MSLSPRNLLAVLALAGAMSIAVCGTASAIIIGPPIGGSTPTSTDITCAPTLVSVGGTTTCTASVSPSFFLSGQVSFASDAGGASSAPCSVTFDFVSFVSLPCSSAVTLTKFGVNNITGTFAGGPCFISFCAASTSAPFAVTVGGAVEQISPLPPVVTGLSASSGSVGTEVRIAGDHFESAKQVLFGDTPALFVSDGYRQITAAVPDGVGTVDVTVVNRNGTSEKVDAGRFTFTAAPGGVPSAAARAGQPDCEMPSLAGKTYRGAKAAMRAAGCTTVLAHIGHAKRGRSHVRSQVPAAGTLLHAGDQAGIVLG